MKIQLVSVALLISLLVSCKKATKELSPIPTISLGSVTDSIVQGEDTILIRFGFADGDADLGMNKDSADLFLRNSWDSTWNEYFFPTDIPDNLKDPTKGLEGIATIKLLGAQFLIDTAIHPKGDTIKFEFYIRDQALHTSNHIITPTVFVKP